MKLSIETMNLLANEMNCPAAEKALDNMIEQAHETFVLKPNDKIKVYYNFRTVAGSIFLETETRPNNNNKKV